MTWENRSYYKPTGFGFQMPIAFLNAKTLLYGFSCATSYYDHVSESRLPYALRFWKTGMKKANSIYLFFPVRTSFCGLHSCLPGAGLLMHTQIVQCQQKCYSDISHQPTPNPHPSITCKLFTASIKYILCSCKIHYTEVSWNLLSPQLENETKMTSIIFAVK